MSNYEKLIELKEEYSACKKCKELVDYRTNIVFGMGQEKNCKIMIIGEAPGKQEDIKQIPFIGRSGKILTQLLKEINIERDEVYITNTILCRPPNNRNPNKIELSNCEKRLEQQIKYLDPKVIITLGNFATKYVLKTKEGISNIHGKIFEIENKKIIPIKHPAVILYNGNNPNILKEFRDDFQIVKKIIEEMN
jgi:DNA polymerase